ncbi:MAG: amidohydrolase [Ruminococcaceae bacterium]|nr:amidohydrolase [Oscillospiraceae bacterium]
MRIIDFHTHPFITGEDNIKRFKEAEDNDCRIIWEDMDRAGIDVICGVFLPRTIKPGLEAMLVANSQALQFYKENPERYIPGIQINPNFIKESCEEVEKAHAEGVTLIGEINPVRMGYEKYSEKGCVEILEYAASLGMTVSCHSTTDGDMNALAEALPHMPIVNAHPNEYAALEAHIRRMKKYENVHLDLSGTGLFRWGLLRHLINEVGKDRIVFGTDYPVCNPAMYVSGVWYEKLTDDEYEAVFHKNAERLLGL